MTYTYAVPVDNPKMSDIDREEQLYLQEVEAVKQWWADSRWRFTKRPYTAESIVQKRGTLNVDWPSNVQSKKLWKLIESRWAVSCTQAHSLDSSNNTSEQDSFGYLWLPRTNDDHANGKVPRHSLCLRLAIFFDSFLERRARSRSSRLSNDNSAQQGEAALHGTVVPRPKGSRRETEHTEREEELFGEC